MLPIMLLLFATPVQASSDEGWEAFRVQVRDACLALAEPGSEAEVNPFGSERYGAAILTTPVAGGRERAVCIVDKQTGAAELTAPFPAE